MRLATMTSARALKAQIEAISGQLRNELFAGIDEEELRICQQVHSRMLANLEQL